MNILEIYKKYNIMPNLAEHQLKVAGVAKIILDNLSLDISEQEKKEVLTACLLHDMGNIIKFNLTITAKIIPEKFTKEDLENWQKIKDEYIKKYGNDEHHATLKIAEEIGVGQRIIGLIDCIGFQKARANAETEDFGKKICAYSDMRVKPQGTTSLEERFLDLRVRYEHKHILMGGNENARLEFEEGLRQIEKQIFENSKIQAQDITEERVLGVMNELKNFEI